MRGLLVVFAAMLASASVAEMPSKGPVESPAGVVSVVRPDGAFSDVLLVGGEIVVADAEIARIDLTDRRGDLILLRHWPRGSGCPAVFSWLNVSGPVPSRSEEFGTCSPEAEISHTSQTVTVALKAENPADGWAEYVFDGQEVVEVAAGQRPSFSGPEEGGEPWIGRSPTEMLRGSDWRAVIEPVLGPEMYRSFAQAMTASQPFAREGDWITARGCAFGFRNCDAEEAVLAVRMRDGWVAAAYWTEGEEARRWGDDGVGLPAIFAEVTLERGRR